MDPEARPARSPAGRDPSPAQDGLQPAARWLAARRATRPVEGSVAGLPRPGARLFQSGARRADPRRAPIGPLEPGQADLDPDDARALAPRVRGRRPSGPECGLRLHPAPGRGVRSRRGSEMTRRAGWSSGLLSMSLVVGSLGASPWSGPNPSLPCPAWMDLPAARP